ncbi:hypothetical protein N0V90_006000 [Kalmusia sp. IMI 367209]|nr:hypothetical protein N0V90_006000 [Kalmusia sp. IMI 367209]
MAKRTTIPPKEEILAIFDQLVLEGIIIHGPYRAIPQDAGGYPLEFRICPAFSRKPHTIGAKLDSGFDIPHQWGPGSDLYCPDERMILAKLNGTHDLAFNMFCADRPQFLLLTLDSWKRQHEPLDSADFDAALMLMRATDDVYIIFNGGAAAGCSRVHKHLQGLRGPPPAFECFVDPAKRGAVPFRFFSHRFGEGFGGTTGAQVADVYSGLISQAKQSLGLLQSEAACPHGLFLWKDWMIVIPRRTAGIHGTKASAATGGMVGSVWLHEETPIEDWLKLGCRNVLAQLGVPP